MNYTPIKLKIKMKEWPEQAKAGAQDTTGLLEALSNLVFALKDSESPKQKFFSKGQFI